MTRPAPADDSAPYRLTLTDHAGNTIKVWPLDENGWYVTDRSVSLSIGSLVRDAIRADRLDATGGES